MSNKGQGSNWIRREKRVAIYARDGFACLVCGSEKSLSLDHILPRSKGGSNVARNLATLCVPCNSSKGDKHLYPFMRARGLNTKEVDRRRRRGIDVAAARAYLRGVRS